MVIDLEDALVGAASGDQNSQKEIFEQHFGKVSGISIRYADNDEEATEITKKTFLTIFNKLRESGVPSDFESMLTDITIESALIEISKKNLEVDGETLMDKANINEDSVSITERIEPEVLVEFIQELPTLVRTVFNMYVIDGFTHESIVKRLGIDEETSKQLLNGAKEFISNKIMEIADEYK